jgi:starch phosphorylase
MIEMTEEANKANLDETPVLPPSIQPLATLSWNYWWSWTEDGTAVFRDLDPEIWEEYEQNPGLLLAKTSEYRLAQMATDPVYIDRVHRLATAFACYLNRRRLPPEADHH